MKKFKTNCINCDKEVETDEYFDGCICNECGGGLKINNVVKDLKQEIRNAELINKVKKEEKEINDIRKRV